MTLALLKPVADKSYKSMTEIDRSPARLLPTSNNRAATPQLGQLLLEETCLFSYTFFETLIELITKKNTKFILIFRLNFYALTWQKR